MGCCGDDDTITPICVDMTKGTCCLDSASHLVTQCSFTQTCQGSYCAEASLSEEPIPHQAHKTSCLSMAEVQCGWRIEHERDLEHGGLVFTREECKGACSELLGLQWFCFHAPRF